MLATQTGTGHWPKEHWSEFRNYLGATNYRIDRIDTHRHASAPNLTTSTRKNRGRSMKVRY